MLPEFVPIVLFAIILPSVPQLHIPKYLAQLRPQLLQITQPPLQAEKLIRRLRLLHGRTQFLDASGQQLPRILIFSYQFSHCRHIHT
jgi:hypothetical protein